MKPIELGRISFLYFKFNLGKASKKKKKIWNFPDLVWPTHPTPVIAKNLEKKIMLLKCFLSNFETFFLTPYQIESFKWLKMQGIDLLGG